MAEANGDSVGAMLGRKREEAGLSMDGVALGLAGLAAVMAAEGQLEERHQAYVVALRANEVVWVDQEEEAQHQVTVVEQGDAA